MIFAARSRQLGLLSALGLCVAVFVAARLYHAEDAPFSPRDDGQVLDHIPAGQGADPVADEVRWLEAQLAQQPGNLILADKVARRHIEAARRTGDARRLAYAETALAPWWNQPSPPLPALLLRATIKQARHELEAALVALDAATAIGQGTALDAEAWRMRAAVLTVLARYQEARSSCASLHGKTSELVEATCTAAIDGITGRGQSARARLAALIGAPGSAAEESTRALSVRGEIALYAGDAAAAERDLRAALAGNAGDLPARSLLADLLLDGDRPIEVLALIPTDEVNPVLLLRRAIAAARVHAPDAGSLHAALRRHADELRARGDTTFAREEARLLFALEHDEAAALPIAAANFHRQSEPWDARLLLEIAAAHARDPQVRLAALDAAAPAQRWLAQSQCSWPPVARAAAILAGMKRP